MIVTMQIIMIIVMIMIMICIFNQESLTYLCGGGGGGGKVNFVVVCGMCGVCCWDAVLPVVCSVYVCIYVCVCMYVCVCPVCGRD